MNVIQCLCFVGLPLSILSQVLVEIIGKMHYEQYNHQMIYDLGHEIFPDLSMYANVDDLILVVSFLFVCRNRLFWIRFLTVYCLRAICIIMTILPKTSHQGYQIFGGNYDKIFSGHVSFTYIATKTYQLPFIFHLLFNGINCCLIISTRAHYTIDVLMAIIICELICTSKYLFLNTC